MPTHQMTFILTFETDDDVAVQEFVFRQLRGWAAESPVMIHATGPYEGQPVDRAGYDQAVAASIEHCLHHITGSSREVREAIQAASGGTVRLTGVGWSPPGGMPSGL